MIISTPADNDLAVAPELAILSALEVSLLVAIQTLNIAHTEILAPADHRHPPDPATLVAAQIIRKATSLAAAINRYRLAIFAPDDYLG
jgi:hypothetical protein